MLIGIAGKICAGKDFLSAILQEHGFVELNLDAFGHRALEQKQAEVLEVFPHVAGSVAGSGPNTPKIVDRKKLGNFVFRNPDALHKLENILHPIMKELVLRELDKRADPDNAGCAAGQQAGRAPGHQILNAAILEKLGFLCVCDIILWIEAPFWLRALRVCRRNGLSLWQFLRYNRAQRMLKLPNPDQTPIFRIYNSRIFRTTALADLNRQLQHIPQFQQFFGPQPTRRKTIRRQMR